MVNTMWPGLKQPKTAPPEIKINEKNASIALTEVTTGSSLLWRYQGQAGWHLYTGAIPTSEEANIEAMAQRYGYAPSDIINTSKQHHTASQ